MQITSSQNLTEKLKKELQKMRKDRLNFLFNYNAEFNRIQQRIQDKTDIERLKDFWLKEIAKSKLKTANKKKLNDLRQECIKELEQSQSGTNDFNYIMNEIQDENCILLLKTKSNTNERQVASLSNNNTLANNINKLNQTLMNNDQNKMI
ncbi:15133_t:CDS:2 [Cetraspora pellucida]|uniref:15133_t:CDS:1 n=1 Tax=Cetraspora pellucida TaxID=1433469 RepID=A0A9N9D491_9GLOM|nr:15133_t:CDS:2 [Cetraspora pellucida]